MTEGKSIYRQSQITITARAVHATEPAATGAFINATTRCAFMAILERGDKT
jgi:hypothetical protein